MKHTTLDTAIAGKNTSLKYSFFKEWTDSQMKQMKVRILNHFEGRSFATGAGDVKPHTYAALDNLLGLAYTSSSSYAGLWICNREVESLKYTGYNYIGFALNSEDRKGYAILWDKNENEIIIQL